MVVTALVIGAVIVAGALDLSASRLGVPEESLLAEAIGSMGTGYTFCIPTTGSATKTNGFTLCTPIGITQTGFVFATFAIGSALQLLGANVIRTELELGTA